MRVFTVKDKTIKLNERDYNQLLKRFDVGKAKECRVDIPCICAHYRFLITCPRCPFAPFETRHLFGCGGILRALHLKHRHTALGFRTISWHSGKDTKARKEIQAIRDFLLTLKRS